MPDPVNQATASQKQSRDLSELRFEGLYSVSGSDILSIRIEGGMYHIEQSIFLSGKDEIELIGKADCKERVWGQIETYASDAAEVLTVRFGGKAAWGAPFEEYAKVTILRDGRDMMSGSIRVD